MSLAAIRTALRAALLDVAGVGKVHEFERIGNAESFGPEHFIDGAKVNGWVISTVVTKTRLAFSEKESTYRFTIRGLLSANDAAGSLRAAENLANAISDALFANPRLAAAATWSDPPEMDPIRTAKVAIGEREILCHIVVLRFVVYERAVVTYT